MSNSTKASKPAKVDKDLPLWQRRDGRWCRKIRGRVHYFGQDRDAALDEWLRVKDYLLAGQEAPKKDAPSALTVGYLCNAYLTARKQAATAGEITQRTWANAYRACERMVDHFGTHRQVDAIRPEEFADYRTALVTKYSINAVNVEISRVRAVLNWAYESELIQKPVRTGPGFKRLPKKAIRRQRADGGEKMFSPAEIKQLLGAATPAMKAMILLAINGGIGNTDLALLPKSALDLENGWLDFPRTKTGEPRRVPLWDETIEALRVAIACRPKPRDPADDPLVFITRSGWRYVRQVPPKSKDKPSEWHDAVGLAFGGLLKRQGLKRPGIAFYKLRHTHRTISDEVGDRRAIDRVMGHSDRMTSDAYVERISDERLRKVTDHVRAWLFGSSAASSAAKGGAQ